MSVQVQQQLLDALQRIDRPGTFCTSGRLPPALPGLHVEGVGAVALPLVRSQALALKKQAKRAPYGKGTETLVDTKVRRVWEIDAAEVTLANPEWAEVLARAVRTTQADLGLEQQRLNAHLYKLLLYEPGSFFLPHRDGEKLARMVATLVITLPSAHEGGELIVHHDGQEERVDFAIDSAFHTQFAAFYADCEHEVRPVTRGFRVSLIYNLTLARGKGKVTAPHWEKETAAVTRILDRWRRDTDPAKLVVLLEHQYSPAGVSFDTLKGVDRSRAEVLVDAARLSSCDASLALVTYWQMGEAADDEDYHAHWDRYADQENEDDDEEGTGHEMGDVMDESLKAEHFQGPEGNTLAVGQLPLVEEELVTETPLGEGPPDREEFEGYTGNAGMTLDRWYYRAGIMLWPAERRFDVLFQAGVGPAVGGLEQWVHRWERASRSERPAVKEQCLTFARCIIAHWPTRTHHRGYFTGYAADLGDRVIDVSPVLRGSECRHGLLRLLRSLGDTALISAWIRGVLARDVTVEPGKELGDLCQHHGWSTFHDELSELFASTSQETLGRHARLLADWSMRKGKTVERLSLCNHLAEQIVGAAVVCAESPAQQHWEVSPVNWVKVLPALVRLLVALEQVAWLDRVVRLVLDRPQRFDLTKVQVPVLFDLGPWLKAHLKRQVVPLQQWLQVVVDALQVRADNPPPAPSDWRRTAATGCKCQDCRSLSCFLDDPEKSMLRLPLAEDRRRHLHQVIDQRKLDTTHVTERNGRPYSLILTKNRASYERALQAYRLDCNQLAQMRELHQWHGKLANLSGGRTKNRSSRE